MSAGGDLGNPLRKFKLVFLGEQSGESVLLGWWRREGGEGGLGYPSPDMRICLKAMYVIRVGVLFY